MPQFLWKAPYQRLSSEARLLYGLLLARSDLSRKHGWIDRRGYVFAYYTLAQVCESIGCAEQKAGSLMKELGRAGLIERQLQGIGRPCRIFVKLPPQ